MFNRKRNLTIRNIEHYINSRDVSDFYDQVLVVDEYFSTRGMKYFGLNYLNEEIISVKFYAHVFKHLSKEDVSNFLPCVEDYLNYLPFLLKDIDSSGMKNKSLQLGIALELKFKKGHDIPTKGFFFNLQNNKTSINLIGFPIDLPPNFQDNVFALGINFEYDEAKTLVKKYYYFKEQIHLEYFAERFKNPDILHAKFVEYAISETTTKINVIMNDLSSFKGLSPSFFSPNQQKINSFLKKKYKCDNSIVFGMYENLPIKASYFL